MVTTPRFQGVRSRRNTSLILPAPMAATTSDGIMYRGSHNAAADYTETIGAATVQRGRLLRGQYAELTCVGPGNPAWGNSNLFKNTRIRERLNVQFRAEAFNPDQHAGVQLSE